MKKRTKFIAVSLSALIAISGVGIAANHLVGGVTKANYRFEINGNALDLPSNLLVLSKDNTTYVPLRFLSENMDQKVGYKQGTITIDQKTVGTEEEQSYKEQYNNSINEIELIKKENIELKRQIAALESSIDNKNLYKGLPVMVESADGFQITVNRVDAINDKDARIAIIIRNTSDSNTFQLRASKSKLLIDGNNYEIDDYSGELLSTVAEQGSNLGKSNYSGDLLFNNAYTKTGKGSLTFYYTSNGFSGERSINVFFDLSK